jgi:hypothetical protein
MFLYARTAANGFKAPRQVGHGWSDFQLIPGGDLNTDGVNDIMGIRSSDGPLFVYASKGGGTFRPAKQTGHGWTGIRPVSGASLDGDKAAGLVAVTASGLVFFYHERGTGTFGAAKVQPQVGSKRRSRRYLRTWVVGKTNQTALCLLVFSGFPCSK